MPVLVRVLLALATLVLAACDSGDGDTTKATTYSLGGAVTGLTGTVTIANGSQRVTRTENGAFTLGNVTEGREYNVTIASQPAGQTCTVYNGSGTANNNVAIVLVSCAVTPEAATLSVGGSLNGLIGRVVLQNNLTNNLAVAANGTFTFTNLINVDGHYNVTVASQPFGQSCTVANGSGIANANVTNITVSCATASYAIGGSVVGLGGGTVTLRNNGGDDLTLAGNGTFTFPTTLLHGTPYAVTVAANPPGLECVVSNSSGIATGTVTSVVVSCALPQHTIGGTITGITGDVILRNNNGNDLPLTGLDAADVTSFTFTSTIQDGSTYNVSVFYKPAGYTCSIAAANGTATADVNVTITCAIEKHTIGGNISGLVSGMLTLQNNGGDSKSFTGDGTFTFDTPLDYGSTYQVTLSAYPGALACNVGNDRGTVTGDVTSIQVRCISTPPGTPVPSFTGTARPRELALTWPDVPGAEYYQLWKSPDGIAPYTQVGANVSDNIAGELISVHRYDWGAARYYVTACNKFGCGTPSDVLQTTTAMPQAIGYFKASNTLEEGDFGAAVALSADGRVLVVGADGDASDGSDPDDVDAPQSGAVHVYEQAADGSWTQTAWLKAALPASGAHFGAAVAISGDGNTIAVGAPEEADSSGAVHVFVRNGSNWLLQDRLQAANAEADDSFGSAVALSADGNTLAASAPGEDGASAGINEDAANNLATDAGAVYVFSRSGGAWSQQAYVKASNTGAGDQFGGLGTALPGSVTLSADGNTLAVGAPYEDSAAMDVDGMQQDETSTDAGAVYVYARTDATWSQQAYVKSTATGASDLFGGAVSLSGDGNRLAIGAPREDSGSTGIDGDAANDDQSDAGAVFLFERSGSSWSAATYLKPANTGSGDWFGARVALSDDGTTLLVGAPLEDGTAAGINGNATTNTGTEAGAGYVFDFDGITWTQSAYVKASNTAATDLLGFAVAIAGDGDTLAMSARGEDSSARGVNLSGGGSQADNSAGESGAVYLY